MAITPNPSVKSTIPTEHQEKIWLMKFFVHAYWSQYPELRLLFPILNGSDSRAENSRKNAEGQRAGVPDYFLSVPKSGYHGLYIEMKKVKGGRISPEQKMLAESLRSQGYRVEFCYGWFHTMQTICHYLNIPEPLQKKHSYDFPVTLQGELIN
jgi:hypothetical protein